MEKRFESGQRFRVERVFPPDFFDGLTSPPLVIYPGDILHVTDEKGSGTWPAYVLVEKPPTMRGWVPERYLRREGDRAVAQKLYDTTTLTPTQGEILTLIEPDAESGWLWCRNERGDEGWFPIDHLSSAL
jgi:hypothetical protein